MHRRTESPDTASVGFVHLTEAMNSHSPHPQVQPAVPLPNGRPSHLPYSPPPHPHQSPYPPYQGSYHHPYQHMPSYSRTPHQWVPPYAMSMPMGRGYQQYPPMHPYQVPQYLPSMRPPPQQAPSSSSMHSLQGILSPNPSPASLPVPHPLPVLPPSPQTAPSPSPTAPAATPTQPLRKQFYPPLPWQSFDGDFPARRPRRRRKPAPQSSAVPVELPIRPHAPITEQPVSTESPAPASTIGTTQNTAEPSYIGISSASQVSSERPSNNIETTIQAASTEQNTPKEKSSSVTHSTARAIVPAIPTVKVPVASRNIGHSSVETPQAVQGPHLSEQATDAVQPSASIDGNSVASHSSPELPVKVAPKSWADLVRMKAAPTDATALQATNGINGHSIDLHGGKGGSLAEALKSYDVKDSRNANKVSFLEPRGLVNTGNTCYINSILQILVFCTPFYTFLEQIGQNAAHSFKSNTPIMDAMIMFMREFRTIDAASSVEQLRMRLKDNELEVYGDPLIPEFVYDVIRQLPRFSSMRRGAQQDAEEFLGFLLEGLHDECSMAMRTDISHASDSITPIFRDDLSPSSQSIESLALDDKGWLEVGPKQKAAITRSSGTIATESPITKIFGGKLRSELRVPGMKNSVTLEPYQPLQLDIGTHNVVNIIDALKGLTRPETLHGDFGSPRGPGSTATKQVTIETLPQVLILHLKRFQYDNAGGTQKIWRKIGYPLELEIPKEVFPQHKRGGLVAHGGLPKYQLIGVVYHHGKYAGGGHYTVDVRRQEGREWIRLDDTNITRIRKEDVAEGGSEEDPKVLAAVLEQHKCDVKSGTRDNVYDGLAGDEEGSAMPGKPWSQVNGSALGPNVTTKRVSGAANGLSSPTISSGKVTPVKKNDVKDNKVAYILFYQKMDDRA